MIKIQICLTEEKLLTAVQQGEFNSSPIFEKIRYDRISNLSNRRKIVNSGTTMRVQFITQF